MNVPFSPPDISEKEVEYTAGALKSGWITTGPKVKLFEQKIAEVCGNSSAKSVCLNSATAALELILYLLGIHEGDEVITSAYTYTASASPAVHHGATLKLVDVAKDSYEMDYDALEAAITEKTKVIVPIDIAGVICDYDRIFEIVNRKKSLFKPENELQEAIGRVAVVSDCAHSFGSQKNGKSAGSFGDFSFLSFHAVKNLTTAEGGAAVWNSIPGVSDDEIYRRIKLLSLHGQSKDALTKSGLGAWEYDIEYIGYKYNMTDIAAAMGLAQLERYPGLIRRRLDIVDKYEKAFADTNLVTLKHSGENFLSNAHLYLTRIPGISSDLRGEIIVKLAEQGIAANVHYKPLPMMTAYKKLGFDAADYPNAVKQFENEITLPLNTCLTDEQVAYVADNYLKILEEYGL